MSIFYLELIVIFNHVENLFEVSNNFHKKYLSHLSCKDETCTLIPYLKKIFKKYINYVTHPLSTTLAFLYRKRATFVLIKNTKVDYILIHFLYFFTFFESLKVVLIAVVAILLISTKLTTVGLLKIKDFKVKVMTL